MKKVSIIVVGSGCRGTVYSRYMKAFPEEGQVVAVCDPRDDMRNKFGDTHGIPMDRRFKDWREILEMPKIADAVFICTQDSQHRDPAVALAGKGYHIMLEKPMAPTPEACREIYDAVVKNNVILAVCHVMRYTNFNRKLKELIDSGLIGKVRNIQLMEPVGYWHMAHSYVRGNWNNETKAACMLLTKSSHDIDILNYFISSRCTKVSSFGNLSYFNRENQPKGAADRCPDCPKEIESKCAYSAMKIYLGIHGEHLDEWPVDILTLDSTPEGVMKALREGPYGRCVFACDNDVVDHQVVNLEFEDGATACFTFSAFNPVGHREIIIMGDQGSLRCVEGDITHYDFLTDETHVIPVGDGSNMPEDAHGGGDFGLVKHFLAAVREHDPSLVASGPKVSLESHLMVFNADKARKNGTVEVLHDF